MQRTELHFIRHIIREDARRQSEEKPKNEIQIIK
jgi:hypothetical protein